MTTSETCEPEVATADGGGAVGELVPALFAPSTQELAREPGLIATEHRRVRRYEELDGAEGRGVFFRPHRFTAADLVPLRAHVKLTVAGAASELALHDVSQNGVAFACPAHLPLEVGELVRLAVVLDGLTAWSGDARVGSIRPHDAGRLVGASFEGGLLDTDELLQQRDVLRWRPAGTSLRLGEKPWLTSGHHPYKALVSELRLLLEEAEVALRDFEAALPWHVMQERSSPAHAALVSRLSAEFGADVLRYVSEIDAALRQGDPADAARNKEFSLRHLHRFLMQAPWMHRARHKPFGYPGDYEVMNYVYEKDFEGATLFARAIGHAFLQTPPALAVRCRKDLMKRQLAAALARRAGSKRPVRFLSIAAGPAREVEELLGELDELPAPLEIVLFDQDKGALAHAHRRLRPLVDGRFPGRVRLVLLNESIKRLLRDVHLFEPFGGFDVIYSCGLFDYLQRATAVGLARNLFAAAAPGGQVLIANMVDHPGRWFMEHHLEWDLLYRTRDELLEIGSRAAPGARLRVLEEETGVNPFVELVRD